ncbi:SRPBCC family protein [Leifsonia sp. NPDC058194]|uniref:SRPBCC family protein n=1 Tax=Leifsonia sp. NPDC058194 TaxID=3346374 RepID=UPI0036DACB51
MAGTTVVERTELIAATPEDLQRRIADLPAWIDWSPWEGLDADLHREYSGEAGSVGSGYAWSGNRKAGAGRMQVTAVDADGVSIALEFTRPFRSASDLRFALTPEGGRTRVIWRMESPTTFMSRLFNIEKLVGKDFEKGLRQLKQVVEG